MDSPNGIQQLPNNHFRHDSQTDHRLSWEYHNISITRVPGFGFGIAVSGGRDNPHFANGDPSIAVSDVLKGGPAEDRLQVNDRIISVNGVCLENVEYATAVHVLRDSGNTVTLVIKRRVPNLNQLSSGNPNIGTVGSGTIGATGAASGVGAQQQQLQQQQPIKLCLTKASKKDDFGIVLGCRLFIKEISTKARDQLATNGYTLHEGDVVTRIHNTNTNDSMSLKEAKKIIDGCKERLNLVVLRDSSTTTGTGTTTTTTNNTINTALAGFTGTGYSHTAQLSNCSNLDDSFLSTGVAGSGSSYSTQNLYVQPPTRPSALSTILDDKNNLTPRGRSRNPLMNAAALQLDSPSAMSNGNGPTSANGFQRPPRNSIDETIRSQPPPPPPPTNLSKEDFYSSRRQLYEDDPLQRSKQSAEPRFISFKKEGSVGIRLTGGNEAGIFVTAVQPGSPASLQGLTPGDKILKVNDMDMHEVTREEAVLFLLSLQDHIDLIVQHCKEEYDMVVANQRGDSFHIKTHFHCANPTKGEMPFKAGDVFRVIDTLHNGVVGAWQVLKVGRGQQEMQRGVIPNKSRAEELATAQFNATKKEMNSAESRTSFFRRKRSNHRRSKSLSKENWDDVVFSDSISKFPAYERVVLRHPGFVRPVVLFGPISDVARDRLTKDFPDKYIVPQQDLEKSNAKSAIVRLSNIRDIMDRGKHALLDITPNAVDKLNYAQFYPIVIFLKADQKHMIKQLRHGLPKSAHKSSKKLLEQCNKLDRMWSHIFSKTIALSDADTWYRKLRDTIDQLQSGAVWMSESKPAESLSDDFLFPMTTSRLSYASSPESDLELSPGPSASLSLGHLPQLVKSSSDPSIATNQDLLEREREHNMMGNIIDGGGGGTNINDSSIAPTYTSPFEHLTTPHSRRTFDLHDKVNQNLDFDPSANGNDLIQPLYGTVPELPPRIDRASKPPTVPSDLSMPHNSRMMSPDAEHRDDYGPTQMDGKREDNSLERQHQQRLMGKMPYSAPGKNKDSYDSVSNFDSTTTTTQMQNLRLGPNAPDDLKSVPNANRSHSIHHGTDQFNDPSNMVAANNLSHDHSKNASISKGTTMIGGSPIKSMHHGMTAADAAAAAAAVYGRNNSRPSHLAVDQLSPRKSHQFETKTDYGKYSRTNSVSQADYMKSPLSPQMGKQHQHQQQLQQPSGVGSAAANIAFKPVPPPKPKNYRPPIQNNQMSNSNAWENGEQLSPRSPNGFYYPSNSHYHTQNLNNGPPMLPPSHNPHGSGGMQPPPPPIHNNNNLGNQMSYSGISNYNGSNHHQQQQQQQMQQQQQQQQQSFGGGGGGGHYMHRPPMDRHALDLAGSREQRGSAFELYRKPQVGGNAGHHHNLR